MSDEDTAPVDQHLWNVEVRHGRDYQKHALKRGVYFEPCDEEEIERLELMHHVIIRACDGLIVPPITSNPRRILDCGFGAAHWAIDVANRYPNCRVYGIDINPVMIPEESPENVDLQIDDLNNDPSFTFPSNYFDLVHSQLLAGGIHANRWRRYVQEIYRVVRPGGWCQMVELYLNAQSDNGSLTPDHFLSNWSSNYLRSLHPFKNPRAALRLDEYLRNAGFEDVHSRVIKLPMCPWSTDQREREIGRINQANVRHMLWSLALYPFTEFLQMPVNDVHMLIAHARNEAADNRLKPYFPLYVCTGRKRRL